jgi:hypothetical protein
MLPIRWIMPIVGALFARAVAVGVLAIVSKTNDVE